MSGSEDEIGSNERRRATRYIGCARLDEHADAARRVALEPGTKRIRFAPRRARAARAHAGCIKETGLDVRRIDEEHVGVGIPTGRTICTVELQSFAAAELGE